MDLREIMQQKVFAVVGDTLREEKYAYKIKSGLIEGGYTAYGIGKELKSINDIEEELDIIDLCINPVRGLEIIKECKKEYKGIVIQPGAESQELLDYLNNKHISYIEGCLLVGLKIYKK